MIIKSFHRVLIGILLILSPFSFIIGQNMPDQRIFVFGDDIKPKFVQYVADLTNLPKPKICYVPTASADHPDNIEYWNLITKNRSIDPYILKTWVSSDQDSIPFEELLLNMDAIIVGGGNTLNMLGIWKAQGIDTIMTKALEKGIILAGGSAGSICWFLDGISDSRPQKLSIVKGLGFLPYSNCPHYGNEQRKELYHNLLIEGKIKAGYASDDLSGILFKNKKFEEAVSINEVDDSYYVRFQNGKIHSEKLKSKLLINKDALPESDYNIINVNKSIKDSDKTDNLILSAFESFIKEITKDDKLEKTLTDTRIMKVFIYKDVLAAVVNKRDYDFYCLSYFYKQPDGKWKSIGEDIGNTVKESEISFRERALMHLERSRKTDNE